MSILVAHSFFLAHDPKQLSRMTPYSPISTLLSAAILREQGHSVRVFDATFADGVGNFEAAIARHMPAIVAIMEDNFNFLTKMCTERRRQDALAMIDAAVSRGCRVLVNGPDAADSPDIYLNAGADAVLQGEGEAALSDIAQLWSQSPGAALDHIPGLVIRNGTALHSTGIRPHRRGLDRLPLPAWDMLDAKQYRSAWGSRHDRFSWNIAASRGCPYACNWCAKPTFGRGYEQRSPASVAREMRLLKDMVAPDHVWFADDIFGLSSQWLQDFAIEVARQNARLPFMMQSRVNLMRPDAVEALAKAGAQEVWLGVESGSQKILDAMDKGSTVAEARAATQALKAHGIRACWFIQLGYPGENWADLSATRELILSERPDDIGVSVAYPLPGTRFHQMVKAQLGARHNWKDSDDLAMLFEGTYGTGFYRSIRDLLHDEVRRGARDDCRWARLGHEGHEHRSKNPLLLATGS